MRSNAACFEPSIGARQTFGGSRESWQRQITYHSGAVKNHNTRTCGFRGQFLLSLRLRWAAWYKCSIGVQRCNETDKTSNSRSEFGQGSWQHKMPISSILSHVRNQEQDPLQFKQGCQCEWLCGAGSRWTACQQQARFR